MNLPKRVAADARRRASTLRDLLSLVMVHPPSVKVILCWSAEQRELAEEWAGREHLAASDNATRRIQIPPHINRADVFGTAVTGPEATG